MNYEELYEDLVPQEKLLNDRVKQCQKLFKSVAKDTDEGNLRNLKKNLASLQEAIDAAGTLVSELADKTEGFDIEEYFTGGDFAGQILEECNNSQVDVIGEYPVFEMFPYRVRFDTENQDIFLDKKKIAMLRPKSLVAAIKSGQEKLRKASFNAQTFLNEMSAAYDLALLKGGKKQGTDILLNNIYKFMTPTSRSRKEYDQQNFAFDIARLYESGITETKDGRRYQFGESRNGKKGIRILDSQGHELFMATICFIEE